MTGNNNVAPATANGVGGGKIKKKQTKDEILREKGEEYAIKTVAQKFEGSDIADPTTTTGADFPTFDLAELTLGKVLGKGGFGTVSEIRAFDCGGGAALQLEDTNKTTEAETSSRGFLSEHCLRGDGPRGDARYAVKILSPEIVADPASYIMGIVDLAVETRFLGHLEHPNIVKKRATAACGPCHQTYFIVMDRLYDTLERRIVTWRTRRSRQQAVGGGGLGLGRLFGGGGGSSNSKRSTKGPALNDLLEERLVAAYDLASAFEYLHDSNIVYRDIKPENIGFDVRQDIKLFDFGLAKELRDPMRNPDGTYNLTGLTGSMRYMAPEVANSEPYNTTCDVYSFAILLWQMMALKAPYELYTPTTLRSKVYNGPHKRPVIGESWSNPLKICLKRSWDPDLQKRNTMKQVCTILRKECVRVREGDDTGLEHNRRRSTHVFRRAPAATTTTTTTTTEKKPTAAAPKKSLSANATEHSVVSEMVEL